MRITLISPTTSAVSTKVAFKTDRYSSVVLSASHLATTEEVDIYINSGELDNSGNVVWIVYNNGTANVTLTATKPSVVLPTGPEYGITKDATATASNVMAHCAQSRP